MKKLAKVYICQNPNCYTHKRNEGFTISTALQEKIYCSCTCEAEVEPEVWAKASRQSSKKGATFHFIAVQ